MPWAEGVDQPMAMRQRRRRVTEKDGKMCSKDVFAQFLSEQKAKRAPKTYRDYAAVLDLFAHHLEGYAWKNLPDGTQA